MSEGQREQPASSQQPTAAAEQPLPTAPAFPQRAIWQLLIAVFVLPRFGELIQFVSKNSLTVRSWQLNSWEVAHVGELLRCCLQVALVCDALGRVTTSVASRWATLFAAIVFLAMQGQNADEALSIWISTGTVIIFWMLWDPGPFAWRIQAATLIAFWMTAVWYSDVGREATAVTNLGMTVYFISVGIALLLIFAAGWRLRLPGELATPVPSRFSFSQMFVWMTCCGLGLALLRFVDFGAEHTFGYRFLNDERHLAIQMLVFAFCVPLLNLLAIWLTLHAKLHRYWIPVLVVAAAGTLALAWYESNPTGPYLRISLRSKPLWSLQVTSYLVSYLPFVLVPTALLTIFRAAGYRWSRK